MEVSSAFSTYICAILPKSKNAEVVQNICAVYDVVYNCDNCSELSAELKDWFLDPKNAPHYGIGVVVAELISHTSLV